MTDRLRQHALADQTKPRICPTCGERYVNPGGHAERCTGLPPVRQVAETIATGGAFTDADAVRVARSYLEANR